jgi:hypothetical protein
MPLVTRQFRLSPQRMAARSRKVVSMAEFQERLGQPPTVWERPGRKLTTDHPDTREAA